MPSFANSMAAHQVRGGSEPIVARHELTLSLEKIDQAFRREIVGRTSEKARIWPKG